MDNTLCPKNDPFVVILGVKGQYGQKYIIVVYHLVDKLMTPEFTHVKIN
jgi:hypothetical protein